MKTHVGISCYSTSELQQVDYIVVRIDGLSIEQQWSDKLNRSIYIVEDDRYCKHITKDMFTKLEKLLLGES